MALTWDVREVANYQYVTTSPSTRDKEEQQWHPVTNAIVMAGMVCGYGQITEANYKKVAKRLAQYQMLSALLGYQDMPEVYVTEEDVKLHIGLKMNVAATSDAAWHKHLLNLLTRDSVVISSGRRNAYRLPEDVKADTRENLSGSQVCELMHAYYLKKQGAENGQDNS